MLSMCLLTLDLARSWSTTGHTEQQLVNFINRLKMKHLKEELPVVPGSVYERDLLVGILCQFPCPCS